MIPGKLKTRTLTPGVIAPTITSSRDITIYKISFCARGIRERIKFNLSLNIRLLDIRLYFHGFWVSKTQSTLE
jgi:hypothetical protein